MSKFAFKPNSSYKKKEWETWTMGDGKTITVDQMTESHAKNVLNLVLKRNKNIREKLQVLGEMNRDFKQFLKGETEWHILIE